jgi:hypothetical protein
MQNNEVNVLERLKARGFDLVRQQQLVANELQQISHRIAGIERAEIEKAEKERMEKIEKEKTANDNKNSSNDKPDIEPPAPSASPVGTGPATPTTGEDGSAN